MMCFSPTPSVCSISKGSDTAMRSWLPFSSLYVFLTFPSHQFCMASSSVMSALFSTKLRTQLC